MNVRLATSVGEKSLVPLGILGFIVVGLYNLDDHFFTSSIL
jgi:hypothetical protein